MEENKENTGSGIQYKSMESMAGDQKAGVPAQRSEAVDMYPSMRGLKRVTVPDNRPEGQGAMMQYPSLQGHQPEREIALKDLPDVLTADLVRNLDDPAKVDATVEQICTDLQELNGTIPPEVLQQDLMVIRYFGALVKEGVSPEITHWAKQMTVALRRGLVMWRAKR